MGAEPYFTAPLDPLPEGYVFEDRLPRFVDMEGDGEPELLTIVTNPSVGAGVWLWNRDGQVRAKSAFHGRPNRWLNPLLGSADFDGDGDQELAIIRTPHIGPTLEILNEVDAELTIMISQPGVASNHLYGDPKIQSSYLCAPRLAGYIGQTVQADRTPITIEGMEVTFIITAASAWTNAHLFLDEANSINFQALYRTGNDGDACAQIDVFEAVDFSD